MDDGPISRSDKYRSVIIDIYDGDDEVSGAPQWRTSLVCCHDSEVEAFRGLKQTARTHQPCVWIQ